MLWDVCVLVRLVADGAPSSPRAVCDANESNEPVALTTAGRRGTWRTVIANWRVGEVVQTVDFRADQSFGEAQGSWNGAVVVSQ